MCEMLFKDRSGRGDVFPAEALRTGDRSILLHEMTPKSDLIDLLSTLDEAHDAKLVELLSSLEQCQVTYATIRNLAVEEQRVTDVDPAAIIRISLEAGRWHRRSWPFTRRSATLAPCSL